MPSLQQRPTRLLQPLRWGLCCGFLGLALVGCRGPVAPPTSTEAPNASPTQTLAPAPQVVTAVIRDIIDQPVWVRPAQSDEAPAQVGTTLQHEDTVRTEAPALVEIGLGTLVFRLGGNATLTLRPNQTLQLAAGQMITWLEGTPPGPVTIQTPVGAAGIRGTTVFVNIDEDPQAPVEIFAWEGEVTFQPTGATGVVVIRDGEQLLVRPGEVDIAVLQQRVRRFGAEEFRQRLEASPLINNFGQPLPTLPQIEAVGETLE
ncbi:FecR family protein [Leptolyngbya sp. BL0902]|uniref:FecR family protein n=1 Tax=Leptolyngbya sp. BL0902 TaxID=1115757 RepID=UPI0018E7D65E|nr:FecR family protein [Leptolyngbya sp. BL0902]